MQGTSAKRAEVPLPGGGAAVFVGGALSFYRHADWQGSSRLASRANGTGMYSSTAYTPYGVPYAEAGTADRSFTGMEQDIASGTYDFAFREYSPAQGRWWTPDPAGSAAADPNNPESWNRFGYVGGNPLEMVDPLGLDQCMDQHGTVVHLEKEKCIGSGDRFMQSNATVSVTDTPDDIALQEAAIAEVIQFATFVADLQNGPPVSGWVALGKKGGPSALHCFGAVLKDKGISVALDVVGVIPAVGNAASAAAGIVRAGIALDHAVASPAFAVATGACGAYGSVTAGPDAAVYSLVGAASASTGAGLAVAGAVLQETKVIPVVGNFVSGFTALWDVGQAIEEFRSCSAGN